MRNEYDWDDLLRDESARWIKLHEENLHALSQETGILYPVLHRWYHRKHKTLRLSTAMQLCRVLRVDLTPPQ